MPLSPFQRWNTIPPPPTLFRFLSPLQINKKLRRHCSLELEFYNLGSILGFVQGERKPWTVNIISTQSFIKNVLLFIYLNTACLILRSVVYVNEINYRKESNKNGFFRRYAFPEITLS